MKRKTAEKTGLCGLVGRDDLSDISESEDSYEAKVSDIERQLKQLDEKTHPEYLKAKRKLDAWYADEKQRVQILHEHRLETIYREYTKEFEACDRDCELEKRRIQDYLTSLCEELKRRLEHDKKNIELTPSGDILDYKPAVTRKLRRRAGSEAPAAATSNFMYWGDLLLCGSAWPLNATTCKPAAGGGTGLASAPSGDGANPADVKSPSILDGTSNVDAGVNSGTTTTAGAGTESSDSVKNTQAGVVETTASNTTTGPTTSSTTTTSSSTAKSNLFGSLGVNLLDGSLLSHLLTSMNHGTGTGLAGPHNPTVAALNTAPGVAVANALFTPGVAVPAAVGAACAGTSALSSFLHGPSAGCSAVAAGLMIPSPGGLVGPVAVGITPGLLPPSTGKKRRQQNAAPTAQLNLLLPENDIYADLTIIRRACAKLSASSNTGAGAGSGRKHQSSHSASAGAGGASGHAHNLASPSHSSTDGSGGAKGYRGEAGASSGSTTTLGSPNSTGFGCSAFDPGTPGRQSSGGGTIPSSSSTGLSVWIDDGRLYCGQKCYQYGASVILEGRDGANQRCTGTITAIGAQDVVIRRSSDHGICRVTVQQLKQGRYTLLPAKPPS